jgi:hypothetical protein
MLKTQCIHGRRALYQRARDQRFQGSTPFLMDNFFPKSGGPSRGELYTLGGGGGGVPHQPPLRPRRTQWVKIIGIDKNSHFWSFPPWGISIATALFHALCPLTFGATVVEKLLYNH